MHTRPYRFSGGSELRRLADVCSALALDWADAWGIERKLVAVQCLAALDAGGPELAAGHLWRQRWSSQGASAWCTWTAQPGAELARLMFPESDGEHVEPVLAPALGASALDALLEALQRAGGAAPALTLLQPAPDEAATYASGYVVLDVSAGRMRLRLLADSAWVQRIQTGSPVAPVALEPLRAVALGKCIEQIPVALSVIAGEAEIGAGTMLTIGVGDVIRLGTAADRPFALAMPAGPVLCHGLIGRRGTQLAVEVTLKS